MKKSSSNPAKLDRKLVEKNRRIHMKGLCFKLVSLIPPHHFKPSKEMLSQQDQLGQAATYITELKERIEELKMRAEAMGKNEDPGNRNSINRDRTKKKGSKVPMVEIRDMGSSLEVLFVSGLDKNFKLYQVIGVLQDEGADVVSASFSTVGDKVFYTLHAQVKVCRVGVDTPKVFQRLQELIC